jgi:hypothetical protein
VPEIEVPKVHRQFWEGWQEQQEQILAPYRERRLSFVPNLLPEQAVALTAREVLSILRDRLGRTLDEALAHADPGIAAHDLPAPLHSPVAGQADGSWLKTSNVVGINVRTIQTFWNVIKYALTIPRAHDAVHLLPIWEPGVVGSLYGISSWQINREFFSQELAEARPALDSVEKQLKAVVNLLHALGRRVGMDVIPHTDRFSEIALANPHYFEWLQRQETEIVDHRADLHLEVQEAILAFVARHGPAVPGETVPASRHEFFEGCPEDRRLRILFGRPEDQAERWRRRNKLVRHLHSYGYEPVPATMAPPFRGIEPDVDSRYVDSQGNVWYDYVITHPQSMSRVFGPLARYKLYGRLQDNAAWQIDFDAPRQEVWRYVCQQYARVQQRYNLDFMRGDMSHVQMRPGGVPAVVDDYYDLLRAVKNYIREEKGVRHFAYFAETFLAPRNVMVYGDEVDHLEASDADTTLGDLQSTRVGSPAFIQRLRHYHDLAVTRSFAPTLAVITGDKDDPRFDEFYRKGNALRLFIALFITDMPSYVALGFATRDVHYRPAPNEHYTKLYVFQETVGPKATHGPYLWGKNGALFHDVTRLRLYAEGLVDEIRGRPTRWLIPPDPAREGRLLAWTQGDGPPAYVLVANTDTESAIENVNLPRLPGVAGETCLALEFSTARRPPAKDRRLTFESKGYKLTKVGPGEGRVYRVVRAPV